MLYTVDLFFMFKVVPFWEFCMLVNSMFLLKFCQISVLRSLVFLTVCSSIILLGFSFCCSKNPTFGHKRFNSSSKIFAWGKCVFFGFCTKIQYFVFKIFNIYANLQYLYKSSIFLYICAYICLPLSGLCTSGFIWLQESERGIIVSVFVLFVLKSSILYFVHIYIHICVHIGLFASNYVFVPSSLWSLCTSRLMSYFRSQREGILSFLLVFAFSYFCNLFKSFVNWFGVFVTFITIFSFSELVWW